IEDGLGPIYNASGCADCHRNPVVGGSSQVTELRAGHWDPKSAQFTDPPGGSLIQDQAIDASIQERVLPGYEVRAFRLSPSTLGAGLVEQIDDTILVAIANVHSLTMQAAVVRVLVFAPAAADP